MEIIASGFCDSGPQRRENEDVILIDNEVGLYLVCDGMGGHAGGEVASRLAAEAIREYMNNHRTVFSSPLTLPGRHSPIGRVIGEAIHRACIQIYRRGQSDPALKNMGTTATLLLATQNRGYIGHVGDSRLYLLRHRALHQLTHDHTLGQELIDRGEYSLDEVSRMNYRNMLTRAVGTHPTVRVDLLSLDLLLNDRILICSDGLLEIAAQEDDLIEILSIPEVQEIPSRVKQIGYDRNCSDNLSIVVLEFRPDLANRESDEARTEEIIVRIEMLRKMFMFHELSMSELARVLERCVAIDCEAGMVLFEEGEEGDALYVIIEGAVEVLRAGRRITTLARGNHVGEMALMVDSPRVAGARTISTCKLLRIERKAFQQLVMEQPAIGVKLFAAISRELSVRLGGALGVIDLLSEHPQI